MKKTLALLLVLALTLGLTPVLAAGDLFPAVNSYADARYGDVAPGDWFAQAAQACYETGLMTGTQTGFTPNGAFHVSECAALAARVRAAAKGGSIPTVSAQPGQTIPWYQSYLDYLRSAAAGTSYLSRIPWNDPERVATRMEFLSFLALATDGNEESLLSAINSISSLPDTSDAVALKFYNAGILTGKDDYGTFDPAGTLSRAEAATMVARLIRPALRIQFAPKAKPTQAQQPVQTQPTEPEKPADSDPGDLQTELRNTMALMINGHTVTLAQFVTSMNYQIYQVDYSMYSQNGERLDWTKDYGIGDLPQYFLQVTQKALVAQMVQEIVASQKGLTSIDTLPDLLVARPSDEALASYAVTQGLMAAKHILVESQSDAQLIVDALAKNPTLENFDAMMGVYSQDPGSYEYPDGYLFLTGDMVEEFESAVKALPVGGYTKTPVKSDFGYHIIWRLDATTHPDLFEDYKAANYDTLLNTWVSQASVTANEAMLNQLDVQAIYERWYAQLTPAT